MCKMSSESMISICLYSYSEDQKVVEEILVSPDARPSMPISCILLITWSGGLAEYWHSLWLCLEVLSGIRYVGENLNSSHESFLVSVSHSTNHGLCVLLCWSQFINWSISNSLDLRYNDNLVSQGGPDGFNQVVFNGRKLIPLLWSFLG